MEHNPKYSARERQLLSRHTTALQSMGYLDADSQPIAAGKYLIPLLLDVFWASNIMNDHTIDVMSGRDEENSDRIPEDFMFSFCTGIVTTIEKMQEAGYENAPDLAFELILPHMDFLLCTLYARFSATMCGIDLVSLFPNVFNPENPDDLHDTLEAFLKYSRMKNAKWSIRITEKALHYA